jgi:hypothetical protein
MKEHNGSYLQEVAVIETDTPAVIDASIPAGATGLSDVIDLGGHVLVAIQMPSTWTAADLTFQVSLDGVTFNNLYDDEGNEVKLTVAASRVVAIGEPALMWHSGKIKLRSGTAALAVDQTAARALKLATRLG